jgi:hypothetical protein
MYSILATQMVYINKNKKIKIKLKIKFNNKGFILLHVNWSS